ncbi:Heat-inducible transcription repressor HrcA [[Mycoplasma] cavipharyngis]|uniref:heat-inducible transcriptional repressor HrcA n=1 Tax=[Mycoplasma] cavipharyngis TaxID=92757 RepID=UPI0037047BE1
MNESVKNPLAINYLSDRQKKILKYIIEANIEDPEAVASNKLKENLLKEVSSATIRNDLVSLEKSGFLVKEHTSSGRVPTKMGYQFYVTHLMDSNSEKFKNIYGEINQIFNKRSESIDVTINETVKILKKFIQLPIVVNKVTDKNELLKRIDIVNISLNQFMLFLITSHANVIKEFIEIENQVQYEDISACLRIFNEKLINLPINQIINEIHKLDTIIRSKVHQYEFIFQKVIEKIILKIQQNYYINKPKVYNVKSLVTKPEVQNHDIDLEKLLDLLENTSIFSQINFNHQKTGKTLINFDNSIEGVTLAATEIEDDSGAKHQIGFLGPMRMDYQLLNQILEFLCEKLSVKKPKIKKNEKK